MVITEGDRSPFRYAILIISCSAELDIIAVWSDRASKSLIVIISCSAELHDISDEFSIVTPLPSHAELLCPLPSCQRWHIWL